MLFGRAKRNPIKIADKGVVDVEIHHLRLLLDRLLARGRPQRQWQRRSPPAASPTRRCQPAASSASRASSSTSCSRPPDRGTDAAAARQADRPLYRAVSLGRRARSRSPARSSASRALTGATAFAVVSTGQIAHRGILYARQAGARRHRHQQLRRQHDPVHGLGRLRLQALVRLRWPARLLRRLRPHRMPASPSARTCPSSIRSSTGGSRMALEKRKFPVIVVDPRVTMFAQMADIHLPITPGTDLVLLNSLAHVILKRRPRGPRLHQQRTPRGFNDFAQNLVATLRPGQARPRSAASTRIRSATSRALYAKAGAGDDHLDHGHQPEHARLGRRRGDQQSEPASPAISASRAARAFRSPASATPWARASGRRARGCPATARWRTQKHRERSRKFWGVDPEFFPKKRGLFMTDIFPAIETGQIKGLWLIATNPMTSMPNTPRIRKTLEKLEFLVVQDAYADVETTQYAHVYLPAALWGREGRRLHQHRAAREPRAQGHRAARATPSPTSGSSTSSRSASSRAATMTFPETTAEVFDEMRELSKGRHARLSPA